MSLEEILKLLRSHPAIRLRKIVRDSTGFFRDVVFHVSGVRYRLQWWCNVINLYLPGGVQLRAHHFRILDSWPNGPWFDLQFFDDRGETIFIIPLPEVTRVQFSETGGIA